MWAYRVGMVLRRFSFNRNPLRRRSDRIGAGVPVGAVALLLVVVRKVLDHFWLVAWDLEWETFERKWRRPNR